MLLMWLLGGSAVAVATDPPGLDTRPFPSVFEVWPESPTTGWAGGASSPFIGVGGAFARSGPKLPAEVRTAATKFHAFPFNVSVPGECTYAPDDAVSKWYAQHPVDIAIVMADNRARTGPKSSYHYHCANLYEEYAKAHGYKFIYTQPKPPPSNPLSTASSSWQKLYAVEQLLQPTCKHEYLFVVDSDSFIARPTLRLEPLLARLGMIGAGHTPHYSMAVATEWPNPIPKLNLAAGYLNGGLVVWKCTDTARDILKHWISYRFLCKSGCVGIDGKWPHEQFSLGHWVMPKFREHVIAPLTGCPLGSAFGDFYVHIVSGVVHSLDGCGALFDARPRRGHPHDRMKFLRRASRCVTDRLALWRQGNVAAAQRRCDVVTAAPPCKGAPTFSTAPPPDSAFGRRQDVHIALVDAASSARHAPVSFVRSPGVTDEMLRAGTLPFAGRTWRFAQFVAKLKRGEAVRVAVFGASITAAHNRRGSGAARPLHEKAWHGQLMAWLNAAHPPKVGEHTKFVMAKGGTDSCFLSKRIKRIAHNAAKSADLVVFEYAVNDGWRDWMVAGSKAEQRETQMCFEANTRLLLDLAKDLALVFLEMGDQNYAKPSMGEGIHSSVAKHYGVPVLSWRKALQGGISTRQAGCGVAAKCKESDAQASDFNDPLGKLCRCQFDDSASASFLSKIIWFDGTHPRAWGHRMTTDLFVHLAKLSLQQNDKPIVLPSATTGGDQVSIHRLEAFVDVAFNSDFQNKKRWCKKTAIAHSKAWRCYEDVPTKPGWVSPADLLTGGETLQFEVQLPRGKYTVELGFLRSYAHMGRFSCTVTDAETAKATTVVIDGLWDRKVSLLQSEEVANVSGSFQVKIETLPAVPGRDGNKVKIQSITAIRGNWLQTQ